MKKLGTYLLYGGALIFSIALVWISVKTDKKTESSSNTEKISQKAEVEESKSTEKVQVYVFHSTNRCYSCVTMGEYVKATVEEFFQPELRDGKIEYREINVDLPANKEAATKFKAVGSSLFLNAIIDGKDNIKEDVQVWRLLGNKPAFQRYLSDQIKQML